jgi:S1-C subfamily serine protease
MVCILGGCGETKTVAGMSAYEVAVKNNFVGTEEQWLASLKEADSAYDIAVRNGFEGTEEEWVASLKGKDGKNGLNGKNGLDATYSINDVYDAYKKAYLEENGTEYAGTFTEFLQQYFPDTYKSTSIEDMVADAVLSCVGVYSTFNISAWGETTSSGTSAGAGVIYQLDKETGSAYILTNYHVVFNTSSTPQISEDIFVVLYGYENALYINEKGKADFVHRIPAKYVGGSMKLDIAVLYVENSDLLKASDAKAATVGDSADISIGQDAIAIGNPEAGGIAVTSGVVSVDNEINRMRAADNVTYVDFRVIRIDTAINGGNSGGGLFDIYGKLIGIVHAKMNSSAAENIAYAVPVNIAKYAADGLIERFEEAGKTGQYAATKCLLGISVTISDSSAYYDTASKRVRIVETVKIAEKVKSDAAAYGKLQEGDIIKAITVGNHDRLMVTREYILIDSMLLARTGDTIVVEIERDGQPMTVEITVNSTTEIDKI